MFITPSFPFFQDRPPATRVWCSHTGLEDERQQQSTRGSVKRSILYFPLYQGGLLGRRGPLLGPIVL